MSGTERLLPRQLPEGMSSRERPGPHQWGSSTSVVFLLLLCARNEASAGFIAKKCEGAGSWRPSRWQLLVLEMSTGV